MKAAWYERNGEAQSVLQTGDMEAPEPAEGEVLVRLRTSGVNPSDVKGRQAWPLAGPRVIPHSDGAGVVEAVGRGVPRERIGERVWLWNGQWKRAFGTAAELIALPSAQAVRLPDAVGFEEGACLGIPAQTALHSVRLHGDIAGKTVLVTGAASSVGYYATQFAKLRGARVIGTASAERQELAREAGADFVIDYRTKDVAAAVKDLTRGDGVDGIVDIDISSTGRALADGLLAPHGKLVCYGGSSATGELTLPFAALLRGSLSLQFILVYELREAERSAVLAELTRLLTEGRLRHAIGARFPLSGIAAAHEAVESGKVLGNVVVDV